jgi:hypothetical protein
MCSGWGEPDKHRPWNYQCIYAITNFISQPHLTDGQDEAQRVEMISNCPVSERSRAVKGINSNHLSIVEFSLKYPQ